MKASMPYRPEIDGLRAVAVIPVVLFHAGFSHFSGGYVGVDVFFVISGYLIARIVLSEIAQNNFRFVHFYERRIRRLLPALGVVCFTTLPFAYLWLSAPDFYRFVASVVATALFVSNILFWRESGYFDTTAELKPFLHTWSLSIEEQFYLLFPLAVLCVWRFARSALMPLLLFAFAASLVIAAWASYSHPRAAFFLLPTRGWELLLGILCALPACSVLTQRVTPLTRQTLSAAGVLMIMVAVLTYDQTTKVPGWPALLPTAGAALIILFACSESGIGRWLASRVMVGIGLMSYSIYLWHHPVLALIKYRYGLEIGSVGLMLVCLAILPLAYVSWRWVEIPCRTARLRRSAVFLPTGIVIALLTALGSFYLLVADHRNDPLSFSAHAEGWHECDFIKVSVEDTGGCWVLRPQDAPTIAVIGDSHAAHLAAGFKAVYGADNDENVVLIWGAGCYPLLPLVVDEHRYFDCQDSIIANAFHYAKSTESIRLVVLSGYANRFLYGAFANNATTLTPSETAQRFQVLESALTHTLGEVVRPGKQVVLLQDVPELPIDPVHCVGYVSQSAPCPLYAHIAAFNARNHTAHALFQSVISQYDGVSYLETIASLCRDMDCAAASPSQLWYQSRDHLTPAGGRRVIEHLRADLEGIKAKSVVD